MVAVALLLSGCAAMAWERSRVDARAAFHQERYCLAERGFKDAVVKAEALGGRPQGRARDRGHPLLDCRAAASHWARRQELDAALAKRRAALPARLPPNCTVS
jgi:hypothetical protein